MNASVVRASDQSRASDAPLRSGLSIDIQSFARLRTRASNAFAAPQMGACAPRARVGAPSSV